MNRYFVGNTRDRKLDGNDFFIIFDESNGGIFGRWVSFGLLAAKCGVGEACFTAYLFGGEDCPYSWWNLHANITMINVLLLWRINN